MKFALDFSVKYTLLNLNEILKFRSNYAGLWLKIFSQWIYLGDSKFINETDALASLESNWVLIDNLELFEHLWTPKRGLQNKINKILRFFGSMVKSTVKYWYRGSVIHLNTARGPFQGWAIIKIAFLSQK